VSPTAAIVTSTGFLARGRVVVVELELELAPGLEAGDVGVLLPALVAGPLATG